MPSFVPVAGFKAGPDAVGILVPPGKRTLVVLRPRALDYDLVVSQPGADGLPGAGFEEAMRSAAVTLAQNLSQALVAAEGKTGSAPAHQGSGFWVHALIGPFALIACRRSAGEAYRPMAFATEEEAEKAAHDIARALFPGPDAGRQLYTNVQSFASSPR